MYVRTASASNPLSRPSLQSFILLSSSTCLAYWTRHDQIILPSALHPREFHHQYPHGGGTRAGREAEAPHHRQPTKRGMVEENGNQTPKCVVRAAEETYMSHHLRFLQLPPTPPRQSVPGNYVEARLGDLSRTCQRSVNPTPTQTLDSDPPFPVPAWKWAAAERRGVLILDAPYPAVLSRFGPRAETRREPEVPACRTCQSPLTPRQDAREAGVG